MVAAVQVNVLLVNKAALGEQSMPLKVAQVPSIWTQKELLQSGHLGGPTAGDVKVMVRILFASSSPTPWVSSHGDAMFGLVLSLA